MALAFLSRFFPATSLLYTMIWNHHVLSAHKPLNLLFRQEFPGFPSPPGKLLFICQGLMSPALGSPCSLHDKYYFLLFAELNFHYISVSECLNNFPKLIQLVTFWVRIWTWDFLTPKPMKVMKPRKPLENTAAKVSGSFSELSGHHCSVVELITLNCIHLLMRFLGEMLYRSHYDFSAKNHQCR